VVDRSSGVRGALDEIVLIVEDDPGIREVIAEILIDAGHSVRAVATLAEARAFFVRWTPRVLIADLQLPDGSSEELLEELAQLNVHVPTLVVSAAPDAAAVAARHRVAFLGKPFSLDDLVSITARLAESATTISR